MSFGSRDDPGPPQARNHTERIRARRKVERAYQPVGRASFPTLEQRWDLKEAFAGILAAIRAEVPATEFIGPELVETRAKDGVILILHGKRNTAIGLLANRSWLYQFELSAPPEKFEEARDELRTMMESIRFDYRAALFPSTPPSRLYSLYEQRSASATVTFEPGFRWVSSSGRFCSRPSIVSPFH